MPDLVAMLNEKRLDALKMCIRLEPKYGKAEFSAPVAKEEMERWETVNGIKIPEDYKAWLQFSGTSRLKGILLEFYPPEKFEVLGDCVIIGKRENAVIGFLIGNGRYIAIEDNKRRNLGYMETILRFWCYDVKELFAAEELEALRPTIEAETAKMLEAEKRAKAQGAGVKEALEYFFARNNIAYLKKWRSFPKCPVNAKNLDSGLIISEPDEDKYYQWQPVLQNEQIDFEPIEGRLGFGIHKDIKQLISSYYYFMLDASIGKINFHINPVTPDINIEEFLFERFDKKSYSGGYKFVKKGKFFLMGGCRINGDDSYLIEVNNDTGEVFAVEYMDRKNVKIADSIYGLLMNGKPIWE